jgi:hypothetical protein
MASSEEFARLSRGACHEAEHRIALTVGLWVNTGC